MTCTRKRRRLYTTTNFLGACNVRYSVRRYIKLELSGAEPCLSRHVPWLSLLLQFCPQQQFWVQPTAYAKQRTQLPSIFAKDLLSGATRIWMRPVMLGLETWSHSLIQKLRSRSWSRSGRLWFRFPHHCRGYWDLHESVSKLIITKSSQHILH
jgi:hypothetical protein